MLFANLIALSTAALIAAPALAQTTGKVAANGELWLKSAQVPQPLRVQADSDRLGVDGGGLWFKSNAAIATSVTVFARPLGRWIDPTTPPHSRTECVQWASGNYPWGGSWKTCTGWKTQFQYMYTNLRTQISTGSLQDIDQKLDECLNTAAVAGALSAVLTSGSAGIAAFQGTLQGCLLSNLPTFVNLAVWTDSAWEDDYH